MDNQQITQEKFNSLSFNDKIKESSVSATYLASFLSITTSQAQSFVIAYNIFLKLFQTDSSPEFANVFHDIPLVALRAKSACESEIFGKAMGYFINENQIKTKVIALDVSNEAQYDISISFLRNLNNPKQYTYDIKEAVDPGFYKERLELFNHIETWKREKNFSKFYEIVIKEQIEIGSIFYIDLDKVTNWSPLISYSKKYPNKIIRLDSYSNKDIQGIQLLCVLNSQSWKKLPIFELDLLTSCTNAEHIKLYNYVEPANKYNGFNFSKVKSIFINVSPKDEEVEDSQMWTFVKYHLNNCPNLETVEFSTYITLNQSSFFDWFKSINNPKLKTITANVDDFESEVDFKPILDNLPSLHTLNLEGHNSMSFSYSLSGIISVESNHIDYPSLEILINNYTAEGKSFDVKFNEEEFDLFMGYFKGKEAIMKSVNRNIGVCRNFTFPYLKNVCIKDKDALELEWANKVGRLSITWSSGMDMGKILNFIKRVRPEILSVKDINIIEKWSDINDNWVFIIQDDVVYHRGINGEVMKWE